MKLECNMNQGKIILLNIQLLSNIYIIFPNGPFFSWWMGFRLSWLYFFTIDALSLWCVNKPCTKVRANSTTEDKRYLLHVKQSSSTTKRSRTISPGQREQAWVEIVEKRTEKCCFSSRDQKRSGYENLQCQKKESIVGCSIIAFVDLVFVHKMSNYP